MKKLLFIIVCFLLIMAIYPDCIDKYHAYINEITKEKVNKSNEKNFMNLKESHYLNDSCYYFPSTDSNVLCVFYMINSTKDTFYYQVNKDSTVTRFAICFYKGGINAKEETYPLKINK